MFYCNGMTDHRYGFNSQIPARIYTYNNKISGLRTIGAVELTLIKVGAKRLGEPVLRAQDYINFDLDRAFTTVARIAASTLVLETEKFHML